MPITNALSETAAWFYELCAFRVLTGGSWIEARDGNSNTGKAWVSVPDTAHSEVDTVSVTARTAVAAHCPMSRTDPFSR